MSSPTTPMPLYGEVFYKGLLHIVFWLNGEFLCDSKRAWSNHDHIRQIGATETEAPYCKNCMRIVIERTV